MAGDDDSIILGCDQCGLVFLIELMVELPGDIPNPMYCPFCGANHEHLSEDILTAGEPSFSVETEHGGCSANHRSKPVLTLIPGGDQNGGPDGKE